MGTHRTHDSTTSDAGPASGVLLVFGVREKCVSEHPMGERQT